MIPTFEFRYLICSYLPGFPLSLAIYFSFLRLQLEDYSILYIIISPLVVGLFVDGIRHAIELIKPFWKDVSLVKDTGKYDQVYLSYILSKSEVYFHMYEFFSNFAISLLLVLIIMVVKDIYLWWVVVVVLFFLSAFFAAVFMEEQEQKVIKKLK